MDKLSLHNDLVERTLRALAVDPEDWFFVGTARRPGGADLLQFRGKLQAAPLR
jgi:hypothetical protein